jgi:hypothetical protein
MQRTIQYLFLVFLLSPLWAQSAPQIVRIGVLSHRGDEATLQAWTPTAAYLE